MDKGVDAFLSYSHQDADVVERISRRIRTYRPPRRSGLTRRLNVFRDVERLTAAPSLGGALVERVQAARHFVLCASPDAAASDYVDQEVAAFLADGDRARLLIVLLRGELAEALPPSLTNLSDEPLYIDLRGADSRTFRLETLRLISALYGVDYNALRREDEIRRLRRQVAGGVTGGLLLLLVASGYLVAVTPAEAWRLIPQPVTRTWSNALAPVTKVAVNRADPDVVVWFGRNARHARDLDAATSSWTLSIFDAFREADDFERRAEAALASSAGKALSVLRLRVPDWRGDPAADLELRLYGLLDQGTPRFATVGVLRPLAGPPVRLPLSETWPDLWLTALGNAPAALLRAKGFSGRDLTGTWIDATREGEETQVQYVGDFSDEVSEVLDAVSAPEFLLFSNDAALERALTERQEQETEDTADIWRAAFVDDPAWSVATEPARRTFHLSREDIEAAREDRPGGDALEAALRRALIGLGDEMPAGDFYGFSVARRPKVAVAAVRAYRDTHEIVQQPAPVSFIKVGDDAWEPLTLPENADRAAAADARIVPGGGLILLTDRAGLFRSLDGGASWESLALGEAALTKAEDLRLVVTPGGAVHVLSVLSKEPGDGVNPLYRLEARGMFERWRIGLADLLLQGMPGDPPR